jgi:natural product biosynthesis luciferase-like monooxygenase protein/amino acid adenylation domain-containing protein
VTATAWSRPDPAGGAPAPAAPPPGECDVSLYFFGDYPDDSHQDKYGLIMAAAEFADQHGFHALWLPERHFHSFGVLFPNPAVLAAALATRTSRIRLHAGSVVLPLHQPLRVAEEWSVVDNLSGGRAGMCIASGWHSTDFALAPENYGQHRELMYEQLATVRALWSGAAVRTVSGSGEAVEVRSHPRPIQAQPPMYAAVVSDPESYRLAAEHDLGIVTHLMAQTVEELAENIAGYRRHRAEYGLDPDAGRVVVLVHTYLGDDAEHARAEAYRPFVSHLRSSPGLFNQVTNSLGFDVDLDNTSEEDVESLLGHAYERCCESRALIGDRASAAETVRLLTGAGADEIACLVDFGLPPERVLAALPALDRLRRDLTAAVPLAGPAVVRQPHAAQAEGAQPPAARPPAAPTPATPGEEPPAVTKQTPASPDQATPAPAPQAPASPDEESRADGPQAPTPTAQPDAPPPQATQAQGPQAPANHAPASPTPAAPGEGPQAPTPTAQPDAPPPQAPAPVLSPVRLELTGAQRRIWVTEQLHPGTGMYHEPKAVLLDGPLSLPALQDGLRQLTRRQPALRAVFRNDGGEPYRLVLPELPLECVVEDRLGSDVPQALRYALDTAGRQVFDLENGPLVSALLLRLSEERHLLFLLAHHIVFDSSSTAVFLRDLAACYRAWPGEPSELSAALPARVAVPPDAGQAAADLEFWQQELHNAPTLELPVDRPRPAVRTGAGASLTHELDAELIAAVTRFAASRRATLFMSLTAAIGAVLGRFSGQRDLVLGTAVSTRPPDAEREIGVFLDTVALRLDLSGDPDFAELLDRVQRRSTTAYGHLQVDFDELVRVLNPRRDLSRNPLFQVLVEYENEQLTDFAPPRLRATPIDVPSDRAPFDLSVYLTHHRGGLRFMVEYDTALFDASTVRRITDYVEQVLRRAVRAPDTRMSGLTALTEADRTTLLGWSGGQELANSSGSPANGSTPDGSPAAETLHGLFEAQARRTPEATALVGDGVRVSYRELEEGANRLARLLRSRGAKRGERVAVLLPRGPELISALLACMKSGAAYLPLDPGSPDARLSLLVRDGRPVLLLTIGELLSARRELTADVARLPVLLLDGSGGSHAGGSDGAPLEPAGPEDPAYCIHTSGSTGTPKGVLVPHRGPANLIRWQLARHRPLRTLQWTSPSFDVSVQEIFSALASGSELVLIEDRVRYDPAALAEAVRRHGVERLFMPCTPLRYLMETAPRLPSLRELCSAGEALELTPALRRFLAAHPECVLYNQYGPTEASVIVASHRVDPDREPRPPIGTPVSGVRLEVLDGTGRPVPVGAVGELHIGGRAVAHGYFGRPAETAAVFVHDMAGNTWYRTGDLARWRPEGVLEYLGRTDDQVKIRGFRVEPGEVRAVLARHPEVREAAVLARRDEEGQAELVAYAVPVNPRQGIGHLRAELAAELPDHLVPRHWVQLDRLPVNTAGKLDRARLPAPDGHRRGAEPDRGAGAEAAGPPATGAEQTVHALWSEILDRDALPVDRSFFQLGGHSLSAVRLLNRLAGELGLELSMADFFRAPTIRAVAARLAEADAAPPAVTDAVPLPSTLRRLWRRQHEHPGSAVYNVVHRIDLEGELDVSALESALGELVRRHGALRGRAVLRGGEEQFEVLAEVPVELPVTDLTATGPAAASAAASAVGPSAADGHGGRQEAAVSRWCVEHGGEPFALDRAPLFRFRLARLDRRRWVLLAVLHHAICDGWSMSVLWHELEQCYNAHRAGGTPQLGGPAGQFTDWARAEQRGLTGTRRAELERYWGSELAGAAPYPALPYDRERPAVLSGRGATHELLIDKMTAEAVATAADRLGCTGYAVLAGAFAVWLSRLCGEPDPVFAVSTAKRTGQLSPHAGQVEQIVGLLGDAVPLRTRVGEAGTFAELAVRLSTTLFDALDHELLPLEDLVAAQWPELAGTLYPRMLFTVVTTPRPELDLHGLSADVRGLPVPGTARNELYVVLAPQDDGIRLALEYSTDLFEPATIAGWAEQLVAVLAELTIAPEAPLHPDLPDEGVSG